ncbi:hypothetical protein X924_00795 [Petrotoga sp. 9PWA.NaAc.5.4]|nr:hypothetical protein X924_00795 [Petrotoga sp. 9PWA.NaAc.5.4]
MNEVDYASKIIAKLLKKILQVLNEERIIEFI